MKTTAYILVSIALLGFFTTRIFAASQTGWPGRDYRGATSSASPMSVSPVSTMPPMGSPLTLEELLWFGAFPPSEGDSPCPFNGEPFNKVLREVREIGMDSRKSDEGWEARLLQFIQTDCKFAEDTRLHSHEEGFKNLQRAQFASIYGRNDRKLIPRIILKFGLHWEKTYESSNGINAFLHIYPETLDKYWNYNAKPEEFSDLIIPFLINCENEKDPQGKPYGLEYLVRELVLLNEPGALNLAATLFFLAQEI